jgi:gas vesicle protein
MFGSFIKGMGIGLIAGATVGLMVSPKTRKKVMKSKPVRAIRSIGEAVEDIMP